MAANLILDNRYELVSKLGAGGFGEAWQAHDLLLEQVVAVKLFKPHVPLDRVLQEARIHTKLSEHHHVVDILNISVSPVRYIVTRLMPDGSVEDRIRAGGINVLEAGRWTRDLLMGLAYAHSMGVLHRDIKPANLLLNDRGDACLSDFGLSEAAVPIGIAEFYLPHAAPEQVQGQPSSVATDIWAAGCTLYRLLTGSYPFGNPIVPDRVVRGDYVAAHHLNRQIPMRLSRIIDGALRVDPARRFGSAGQMLAALSGCPVTCSFEPAAMAGAVEAWQSTARGKVRFQLILSRKGTGVTLAVKRDLGRGFRDRHP